MSKIVHTTANPDCPECGAKPMILRTRRSDSAKFWGCRNFPDCKGTRNIDEEGEPISDEINEMLDNRRDWRDMQVDDSFNIGEIE